MSDAKEVNLRVGFDGRLKLKFLGSRGTTDAGLLAYRELDEVIGLTEMGADVLTDSRQGSNKQHQFVPLLRQSIYSRLTGYADVNDAERLCVDPTLRRVVGGRLHCRRSTRVRAARWGGSRQRRSAPNAICRR